MSLLVNYDNSSDENSENEDLDSIVICKSKKINESPSFTNSVETNNIENDNLIISTTNSFPMLPCPTKSSRKIEEEELIIAPSQSEIALREKFPVKKNKIVIQLPTLNDSDSDSEDVPSKKACKLLGKSSLFKMLPPPKSLTSHNSFLPKVLSKKLNSENIQLHKPNSTSNKVTGSGSLGSKSINKLNKKLNTNNHIQIKTTNSTAFIPKDTSTGEEFDYPSSDDEFDTSDDPASSSTSKTKCNFFSIPTEKNVYENLNSMNLNNNFCLQNELNKQDIILDGIGSKELDVDQYSQNYCLNLNDPLKNSNKHLENIDDDDDPSHINKYKEKVCETIKNRMKEDVLYNRDGNDKMDDLNLISEDVYYSGETYTGSFNQPSLDNYLKDEKFRRIVEKEKLKSLGSSFAIPEGLDILDINFNDQVGEYKLDRLRDVTKEQARMSHSKKHNPDMPTNQQRRKHQITYLAHQAKERELELKNQWSENRYSKKMTQSKYGF